MHTGMLWFDNTPGLSLTERIEKAAEYYRRKYHQEPTLCLIHPSMGEGLDNETQIGNIKVRKYNPVLPRHLWIGIEVQ